MSEEKTDKNNNGQQQSVIDLLFLRTGYLRDYDMYAPNSLFNQIPVDVNQIKDVRTDVAVRLFAFHDEFTSYVNRLCAFNTFLMKKLNKKKYFSKDSDREKAWPYIDAEKAKEIKPLWTKMLPTEFGPLENYPNPPKKPPRLRKALRKIFSSRNEELERLEPGPIVCKFVSDTQEGEINYNLPMVYAYNKDLHAKIDSLEDFRGTYFFLDDYGTDFLQCKFYRHRLRYKACQVIPLQPVNSRKRVSHSYAELKDLALRVLGGEFSPEFNKSFPESGEVIRTLDFREYELVFYSGTVVEPIFEPIQGVYKWIPIWQLVKRYWELNIHHAGLVGDRPWRLLQDVWILRSTNADMKAKYHHLFWERHVKRLVGNNFSFRVYWENCLSVHIMRDFQKRFDEFNTYENQHEEDIKKMVKDKCETLYKEDLALMDELFENNWFYMPYNVDLNERLNEMGKKHNLLLLFYERDVRMKFENIFNTMFRSCVIFINLWNLSVRSPRRPYMGILIDYSGQPELLKKMPDLPRKVFSIQGDFFQVRQHTNPDQKINYRGLNMVSMNPVVLPFGYTVLDASYNFLSYLHSSVFDRFQNLTSLDLSANSIQSFKTSPFHKLENLETLNLSRNLMARVPPLILIGLKKLKTLDLSFNLIRSIEPKAFEDVTSLETLRLNSNYIRDLDTTVFDVMPQLTYLDLSSNIINGFKNKFSAKSLVVLLLNDNCINYINRGLFGKLENLELLNLSHNYLPEVRPRAFENIPNLQYLFLNSNRIACVSDLAFVYCNKLKFISLADNRLVYIHSNVFLLTMLVKDESNLLTDYVHFLMSAGRLMDKGALRCVQLYDNMIDPKSAIYPWNKERTLPSSKFNNLRYFMLKYDHNFAVKMINSKHFKKYRDIIKHDIARYEFEKGIYEHYSLSKSF